MKARDNPFSTDRVLCLRYRLRGTTWEDLLDRLSRLGYRAAIVGPEGAGKTTLLEDLEPHLTGRGFRVIPLRLNRERRRFERQLLRELFARTDSRTVLLLDGAEQMSPIAWWQFRLRSRAAGGLVITSHRSGLLPTLIDCSTTPELLLGLLRELIGDKSGMLERTARRLFAKHHGNLRDVLREFYDLHATDAAPGELLEHANF